MVFLRGTFFEKISKQIMEIKNFLRKKLMKNFVWNNIEMFLKENFVVTLDF